MKRLYLAAICHHVNADRLILPLAVCRQAVPIISAYLLSIIAIRDPCGKHLGGSQGAPGYPGKHTRLDC